MAIARRRIIDADGTECVVLELQAYRRLLAAAGLTDEDDITSIPNPATGNDIEIDTGGLKPTVIDEV